MRSMGKKYKNSIMTTDLEHCYLCGGDPVQMHHVFGAYNRDHATEDGLYIGLCWQCHTKVHTERSQRLNYQLKQIGQRAYEEIHSHDEFMKRYGKNYL